MSRLKNRLGLAIPLLAALLASALLSRPLPQPPPGLPTAVVLTESSWSCTDHSSATITWRWDGEGYVNKGESGRRTVSAARVREFLERLEPSNAVSGHEWAASLISEPEFAKHRQDVIANLDPRLFKGLGVLKNEVEGLLTVEVARSALLRRQQGDTMYIGGAYELEFEGLGVTVSAPYRDSGALPWTVKKTEPEWTTFEPGPFMFVAHLDPKTSCSQPGSLDIWKEEHFWRFEVFVELVRQQRWTQPRKPPSWAK